MSTSREIVRDALEGREPPRVPRDLGGMLSTGISCFAYPSLVEALGLPPRRPRVHDTMQMLALPDLDVLDALGCDVVCVFGHLEVTNAFPQPQPWKPYDFGGRLEGLVLDPGAFRALPDGSIEQPALRARMVPAGHVFDFEHGGQPTGLEGDLPLPDIDAWIRHLERHALSDEALERQRALCRRVREESDRAVFFNGLTAGIGIANHGGIGIFPMLCLIYPDHIAELHERSTDCIARQLERQLDAVGEFIDIYMLSADDWGTQGQTIASPEVYQRLFQPSYRRLNDLIHRRAPQVKTFLHSCGAIHGMIPAIAASGFDILNPVQWPAGGLGPAAWKQAAREAGLALWGGGANAQGVLPHASPDAVAEHVREVVAILAEGGGYVFNCIHNLLAEIPGEKVVAMYRALEHSKQLSAE